MGLSLPLLPLLCQKRRYMYTHTHTHQHTLKPDKSAPFYAAAHLLFLFSTRPGSPFVSPLSLSLSAREINRRYHTRERNRRRRRPVSTCKFRALCRRQDTRQPRGSLGLSTTLASLLLYAHPFFSLGK